MDQASSPEYDRDISPEDRDRVFRERYAQALAEMRYGMGPLSVAPVFSPNASGAKVSANVAGVEPYVVIDPSTGRPVVVEQGVTYGSGTPESGYQLRYSKNERTGQPVYSGAYRRRLDRDSEITAQGSYVPMPGRDAYQAMLQYRKRFAEGGEAKTDDDPIRKLYRETLAREADTGGLEYWRKEFGPEVDVAERMRFIEGAQPEVQKRMAAGDTTLPAYMRVAPEVRSALQSTDITTDEYKKLANYFGNQWIAGEAEDPASLTRRDYIERPRSGYDLATFLATRSQQHGAQADTAQRLSNLLAPYMGNVGKATSVGGESLDQYVVNPLTGQTEIAQSVGGESLDQYVVNPLTGQTEIAQPLGVDNTYRIYRAPHHGSIGDTGNRYAVGMDYRVDPVTGQTEFVAPYASPYTDTGHNDWQVPLGILGTAAGMYFFPGMDFSSMLSRGAITLATEGAKRAFKNGGEVTNFVKRQAGSPEEGEAAAESRYDMANNRLRGLNEELQDKIEMYRQGQITAKDLQEFFPGYSTFDLDRMFGTTDTDLPRHPNMAQPRLTPKFLADALNLEDILKKETETQLREGRKHPFLLRKDMPPGWETNMAQGGEVTKFVKRQAGSPEEGEVAEQMTVGTRLTDQEMQQPSVSREAFEKFKTTAPAMLGIIPQAASTVAGNILQGITDPKAHAKRSLENIAKQLRENPEEFVMNWTGGGLGGVLKPKGGVFPKAGTGSGIDNYLNRVEEMVGREAQDLTVGQIKTLNEFIRDKGRKYLTSTYTSGSDPLKEALLEGRMPALGTDAKNFRDYMLQAVREGNPNALEDFERMYDTKSGLGQFVVTPSNYEQAAKIRVDASRQMLDKIAKEGVPENLVTEPFVRRVEIEDMFKDYSPEYQKDLARNLLNQELGMARPVDVVDETLIRAAREGEVFYDLPSTPSLDFLDPKNLAKSLSTLNPDKLANMSFPEAVIQGTKNTRLQRDWDEVIKKVENNKSVPREMFDIGTETFRPMGEDKWVRLTTPQAVQLEGAAMHHSVGGYAKKGNYGEGGREALTSGRAQVFSLRGPDNRPRVTIEARKNDDGTLFVKQVKGNFNGLPDPADQEIIVQFLKDLPIDKIQPERYTRTITGEELEEATRIDWSERAGFGARSIF